MPVYGPVRRASRNKQELGTRDKTPNPCGAKTLGALKTPGNAGENAKTSAVPTDATRKTVPFG
jgi:hypothetical protein